jgi:hypothetical protein
MGMKANIALRRGEWNVALRASLDSLASFHRTGDHATARNGLYALAVELCQGSAFEPSAVIMGKADSLGTGARPLAPWGTTLASETDAILLEELGEQKVAELAARGAALGFGEAVDYAQAEAEKVLAATSAPAS